MSYWTDNNIFHFIHIVTIEISTIWGHSLSAYKKNGTAPVFTFFKMTKNGQQRMRGTISGNLSIVEAKKVITNPAREKNWKSF